MRLIELAVVWSLDKHPTAASHYTDHLISAAPRALRVFQDSVTVDKVKVTVWKWQDLPHSLHCWISDLVLSPSFGCKNSNCVPIGLDGDRIRSPLLEGEGLSAGATAYH